MHSTVLFVFALAAAVLLPGCATDVGNYRFSYTPDIQVSPDPQAPEADSQAADSQAADSQSEGESSDAAAMEGNAE